MPADNAPPVRPVPSIQMVVNGSQVEVPDSGSLLDALRDSLGNHEVKDGCSPQGQCGCCTVLVDGAPRVACVTPVRRVRNKTITTVDGLDDADEWAHSFCATGASQCGFCTPGIITRLSGLRARKPDADHDAVEQALLAHLCRCTGWRTILDAWDAYGIAASERDLDAAARRATLEGGAPQIVGPDVALGRADFVDDTAPTESLVAVLGPDGDWTLDQSVAAARLAAGKVQGRRTTAEAAPPIPVPEGDWDVVLQTSWVEPAYLEPDASWAAPGSDAADVLANGGAFGGKEASDVSRHATDFATESDAAVRVLYSREDVVRRGPKRPPIAAGLRLDGTGVVRVARTAGVAEAVAAVLPHVTIEEVDVAGPPTSTAIRAAGWAEAVAMATTIASAGSPPGSWIGPITNLETLLATPAQESSQDSGRGGVWARVDPDSGAIEVRVDAGDPLDEVVLRSFCVGAAHQAASWVTSESLTVDEGGNVHDLTIRSFGILRAVDTPAITVTIEPSDGDPVAVSDAVFAAVAAAVWLHQDTPPVWPTGIPIRTSN